MESAARHHLRTHRSFHATQASYEAGTTGYGRTTAAEPSLLSRSLSVCVTLILMPNPTAPAVKPTWAICLRQGAPTRSSLAFAVRRPRVDLRRPLLRSASSRTLLRAPQATGRGQTGPHLGKECVVVPVSPEARAESTARCALLLHRQGHTDDCVKESQWAAAPYRRRSNEGATAQDCQALAR